MSVFDFKTSVQSLWCLTSLVAVGTEVTPRPPHRSVRAELPHQMWSTTFDALCGPVKYVVAGPNRHDHQ